MVTIEQKLTLFSKLLNQDIKEEANEKFQALEKEYEKKMAENKFETDKEATNIVEQARKRAEIKKIELISKGRMTSKKELMQIKEELITRFLRELEVKIKAFTASEGYEQYLKSVIQDLQALKDYKNTLIIYLTENDLKKKKSFIQQQLVTIGLNASMLQFEQAEEDILGGLIIKDPLLNMRIDESIRTTLEETKDKIVEKISLAIGEAGDIENE